jgi:8-oxo-dGTP diphosphatase
MPVEKIEVELKINGEQLYVYNFPRPSVAVDCVIFGTETTDQKPAEVLLIQRKNPPFKGSWALPGGFLEMDEVGIVGAIRELQEETGITAALKFIKISDAVDRDPRGRVIALVYGSMINKATVTLKAGDDAKDAQWWPVDALPNLAFDHKDTIQQTYTEFNGQNI